MMLAILFLLGAPGASALELKAADLKGLVESRNERVLAKKKESEAAQARSGFFLRSFLPSAELYAAQEKFRKNTLPEKSQPAYGGELKLNLFNGGRDLLEGERRSLEAERKENEGALMAAGELSRVRELYWRSIYLRDYTELLREARKNSATSLQAAERRFKSGVATEADRVEFEMQDIDLKRELERSELERKNLHRTLAVALAFPEETVFELPEELIHEHDWEPAIQHGEADHAFLVKPAELQAAAAAAAAESAGRAWWPKLDAYAGYHQLNQREETEHEAARDRRERVVGLRLSMDLFNGLLGNPEANAAAAEAEAARLEASFARKELESQLHGQIGELKLLHAQVHEAEENVKRAERYLRLTQSEYGRGVKNSPDMVGAMEKLLGMRQKRLEIIRDFQMAKSLVLARVGR